LVLIVCGIVAGPFYVLVGLIQVVFRPGFDITRHSLSLLTNGLFGWIQVINFIVTGSLLVAAAVGVKRIVTSGRGRGWAAPMLGLYGLGLIGAGIFTADPALGFPPGTPPDNNPITWHGLVHFMIGTIGFAGFIATCFIFARRFSDIRERKWAIYSWITGALFLVSFFGIASGSKGPVSLYFALSVTFGFVWLSFALWHLTTTRQVR
jgi:hypothetical protein